MENRYWQRTGTLQAAYQEMEDAGFEYTQTTEFLFRRYYRYYNDGDLPGWARNRRDLTRYTNKYGRWQWILSEAGEDEFERRITARIEIEYRRYERTCKPA